MSNPLDLIGNVANVVGRVFDGGSFSQSTQWGNQGGGYRQQGWQTPYGQNDPTQQWLNDYTYKNFFQKPDTKDSDGNATNKDSDGNVTNKDEIENIINQAWALAPLLQQKERASLEGNKELMAMKFDNDRSAYERTLPFLNKKLDYGFMASVAGNILNRPTYMPPINSAQQVNGPMA